MPPKRKKRTYFRAATYGAARPPRIYSADASFRWLGPIDDSASALVPGSGKLRTELIGTEMRASFRHGGKDAALLAPDFGNRNHDFRLTQFPPDATCVRSNETSPSYLLESGFFRYPTSERRIEN